MPGPPELPGLDFDGDGGSDDREEQFEHANLPYRGIATMQNIVNRTLSISQSGFAEVGGDEGLTRSSALRHRAGGS